MNDLDILIVMYLDGSAGADEVAVLNGLLKDDAEARSLLREASFQALTLADLGKGKSLRERRPEPAPRWNVRALAAAAVLLLAGLGWAAWLLRGERPLVTVVRATGAASWSSDGDPAGTALGPDLRLGPGTVTLEGAMSSAELKFDEGSTLMLAGPTELSLAAGSLFLRRGLLTVEARRPLRLRTPTAEIDVLGTSFFLSAAADRTTVTVGEGTVRMRRSVDGASTDVPQGTMATATLDGASPLEKRPIPTLLSAWRVTFDAPPPATWQGEWAPGLLKNVPDVSYRRKDGTIVPAYVVSVRDPSALATVRPDTTLRVKWRVRKPGYGAMLLISVRHPDGKFAGNFQTDLRADTAGWQVFSAPLSSLETRWPQGAEIPSPGQVTLVFLACYTADAQLEVAEVALE